MLGTGCIELAVVSTVNLRLLSILLYVDKSLRVKRNAWLINEDVLVIVYTDWKKCMMKPEYMGGFAGKYWVTFCGY
jgi:hypothetical protein